MVTRSVASPAVTHKRPWRGPLLNQTPLRKLALVLLSSLPLLLATPVHGQNRESKTSDSCFAPQPAKDLQSAEERQTELFLEHAGKKVSRIEIAAAEVFDTDVQGEDNSLYRFLNRIHITTLDDVIASQLLFKAGQPLDPDAVMESARLLRRQNYLADAYITLSRVCDDQVEVTVHTQDSWSTEPQISFGHSGGETSSGLTLSEGNFLGSGNSIAVGYRQDADRSGVTYHFSSNHFLNTRLAARVGYSDNSDGEDSLINIALPFYSLRTPYAYGVRSETVNQREPIRSKGEVVEEYRHHIEHHEAFAGRALGISAERTHRLLLGITKELDAYEVMAETVGQLPQDITLLYPWAEYQYIENEYAVFRNIDQIHRREDVAMGKEAQLRIGYGSDNWNETGDVLRYSGSYSDMLEVGKHHILRFEAHMDGRRHTEGDIPDTSLAGAELAWYLLEDYNNRWFARLRYDFGKNLQPHEKLTVGGTVGVRGYPLDYQRGDERYVFSLERRYFSDLHLFNLFRVGAVAFFDTGRAWGSKTTESSTHLSNVGMGLRISSSKAKIGHIVHIDVAFPLADKQQADSVQWLIMAEQAF